MGAAAVVVPSRSRLSVRQWLLLMSGTVLAPVVILVAVLLINQYRASAAAFEGALVSSTRGLALQGEALLNSDTARLEALSVRRSLQSGDFVTFERELREAARGVQGWFLLMDDAQQQIINTKAPPGAALPGGGVPAEAWQALQAGRTRISGVTVGKLVQRPIIAIDTPVVVGTRLYGLSYIQEPMRFLPLLRAGVSRPGWIGVLIDQDGRIVARTLHPEATTGLSATPDLRRAVMQRREGVIRSRTLEGQPSILAFSRAPSGWTFVIAVPQRELQSEAWRAVLAAAAQLLLLLGAATAAAFFFSRRILADLEQLEGAAAALGERRAVEGEPAAFAETERVQQAISAASVQLRRHDAEQKQALERHKTLVNELNHRVKNTLATVQSLARQSRKEERPRAGPDPFEDRLLALARAHDLLTANSWQSADLKEIVQAVLEPYAEARAEGPAFRVSSYAAVSLVLVLHELATNAAKYGALSTGGQVHVAWQVEGAEPTLELTWLETGAAPERPGPEGFGSRLIRSSIERELGGRVERTWTPDGVQYRFRVPVSDRLTGHAAS